uniref:Anion exchange protein n=1 Tax=Plectus sambesii TaxID=2011161 RepID=A0A914VVU0_9BILA
MADRTSPPRSKFVAGDDDDEPVPDERAQRHNGPYSDDGSHHRDSIWIGMGIHLPAGGEEEGARKRRHRRKKKSTGNAGVGSSQPVITPEDELAALAPGQRVMFLLKEEDGEDGLKENKESHPALFTEMGELTTVGLEQEWRETARWVKFEEDVEEGGNRWSKPHVATLSLHSLFELRSCLLNGTVIIDMEADDLPSIVDIMLEKMIATNQLEFMYRDDVREALLRRHKHQYEHKSFKDSSLSGSTNQGGFLSAVRSISDIGKSFSHGRNLDKHKEDSHAAALLKQGSIPPTTGAQLSLPKVGSVPREIVREGSHADVSKVAETIPEEEGDESTIDDIDPMLIERITQHKRQSFQKTMKRIASVPVMFLHDTVGRPFLRHHSDSAPETGNTHFMKKLPLGAEASNVLIGEVEFLQHHITAFVRLKTATLLGDLTEVPVPTRFLFILLGPTGHSSQYREIGRAIATLMSDEIFHDVAYKARNRTDLLDGVDEFLDQVTVLPPGEWDPNIRIEPPSSIPSQEKRKQVGVDLLKKPDGGDGGAGGGGGGGGHGGGGAPTEEAPDEGHANDPALKRTGKLFGGLWRDIQRKKPFYLSDFTDAFNMQSVATFAFMYFALLAPIVTFGGLLEEATHQRMAAMENLFGGAICGIVYHLFSGQPLTVIGSTGPVLVFETIVFDMCTSLGLSYLSVRLWINLWTALILMIMVATDASSLVSYITRFTEESFATLIAVIFIYEAVLKLWNIRNFLEVTTFNAGSGDSWCACTAPSTTTSDDFSWVPKIARKRGWSLANASFVNRSADGSIEGLNYDKMSLTQCIPMHGNLDGNACYPLYDVFLMSLMLMLGTFFLAMTLKGMRNSCYFPSKVRQVFSDFAVMIAIVVMVGVDLLMGINTPKLNVPSTFRPTWEGRGWIIPLFDGNPWWSILLAFFPALLACILIFMDQQITAVIVNRKENKLKKGCGYHLDLFVLAILIAIVGILGLPIYVAATVLSINHVNSLRVESESRAPGEVAQFVGVREQRVTGTITFLLIGLSVLMTRVLSYIPMPVLYGVFMYMGISALGGIQLFDRFLLFLMPMKYQPDTIYIRHVPINVIHRYTLFQIGCLAMLWVIKSIKKTSITFPIMLVVMLGVRKVMEKFFEERDLKYLDDKMPDFHLRKKEDAKKKKLTKGAVAEVEAIVDGTGEGGGDDDDGGLRPVKTAAHLHIPMASGNVMKIPLSSIQEKPQEERFNLSNEVNRSGLWKHIASESQPSLGRFANGNNGKDNTAGSPPKQMTRLATPEAHHDTEDDNEPITIKVTKPSPHPSSSDLKKSSSPESQPLLSKDKASDSDSKQESSV